MRRERVLAAGLALVLVVASCGSAPVEDQPITASEAPEATVTEPGPTVPAAPDDGPTAAPSTEPAPAPVVDDVAPPLVVTDPADGATVSTGTYLFRGTTEPGARVLAAGRYEAEVDEAGNWSIALVLNPGGNLATLSAIDDAGNVTEVQVAVDHQPPVQLPDVMLSAEGLGMASFGDDPEATLATLTAALGAPDLDSGWADPSVPETEYLWPGCPGVRARVVAWTGVLGVVLSDWDMTSEDPRATIAGPVFAGAGLHHQSPVPTAEGARAGDRLGDVREIYGTRLHVSEEPDDAVGLYSFGIDEPGSPLHRSGVLRGWVYWPDYPTGAPPAGPPDDTWQIGSVTAGVSCDTP